ncbi:MAG: acyl carrier protein [Spirochaetia bacterium]|nr:acyl carrier protein [Spirochaetia bacterium]
MQEKEVFDKIVGIIGPFAKNKESLNNVTNDSNILKDFEVNSSRLVDIILALEDEFDIEISDEEAEKIETIGDATNLIKNKI